MVIVEGKDFLNGVIVSGYVVCEIIELKVFDKEVCWRVMEVIVNVDVILVEIFWSMGSEGSRLIIVDGSVINDEIGDWMDGVM